MKAIVNVGPHWGIGKNGSLLCTFPEDFKFFRDMTINKTIIYGRKTLNTFPNKCPLKYRTNILLTHTKSAISSEAKESVNYYIPMNILKKDDSAVILGASLKKRIEDEDYSRATILITCPKIKYVLHILNVLNCRDDAIVIGGESIYRQLLPKCDTVYVTKTNVDDSDADAHFENLDESDDWDITKIIEENVSSTGIKYKFLEYSRKEHDMMG